MSSDVQNLVAQTAASLGLDPALALAVASAESGFNQNARSGAGAIGVMQLEPGTAAQLGVNPYDVADNVRGGVLYLQQQLNRFGDPALALAAYNWGPARVASAVVNYGDDWLSHAPAETRAYVGRILATAGDAARSVVGDLGTAAEGVSAAVGDAGAGGGIPGVIFAGLAVAAYLLFT